MIGRKSFLFGALALAACAGIEHPYNRTNLENEYPLVLSPGQTLEAKTLYGKIEVFANDRLGRTYRWDNGECERSLELEVRKSPWRGVSGAYNAGTINPDWTYMWKECNGIVRAIAEEGHVNFSDFESFALWVVERYMWFGPDFFGNIVYSNGGMFLQVGNNPNEDETLHINLLLITINGEKPTSLPGSRNDAISIK